MVHERTQPLLQIHHVSKQYPGVLALDNVSLEAERGEVHALLGANGAGKSTLIKILVGAVSKDSGTIIFDGEQLTALSPQLTAERGISCIFQDPALVPLLTVEQNIFLGHEIAGRFGWLSPKEQHQRARQLLEPIAPHISPRQLVRRLRTSERQLVALAKALVAGNKLIIMDEPTASMTQAEIQALFNAIQRLRAAGVCVLYVTHRLEEVFQIADRATVLRDGQHVLTRRLSDISRNELINSIIGRELRFEQHRQNAEVGQPLLTVNGLTRYGAYENISFEVRAGEVVALAGLVGSGRSEVARALIHADPFDAGHIQYPRPAKHVHSPADAISAGIAMIPEDRKQQGIVPKMTVADNMILSSLWRFSSRLLGWIQRQQIRQMIARNVKALDLRPIGAEARPIETLSGGNQQKAIIARAIESESPLLILDEPTAGVDIGAKAEIHRLILNIARDHRGILLISSEIEEVLTLADRILVLRQGQLVGALDGKTATSHDVLRLALGENANLAQSTDMPDTKKPL